MVQRAERDELVTKGFLEETLDKRFCAFRVELIKEVRVMIHQAVVESAENAKIYYQAETEKYMKVILDEWRDERRAFYDGLKGVKDVQENHEKRISYLESVVA